MPDFLGILFPVLLLLRLHLDLHLLDRFIGAFSRPIIAFPSPVHHLAKHVGAISEVDRPGRFDDFQPILGSLQRYINAIEPFIRNYRRHRQVVQILLD